MMGILSLLGGALTFNTRMFDALRERSDVFYRGFLVVLLVGILAGMFQAGEGLLLRSSGRETADQIAQQAMQGMQGTIVIPPEVRPMVESYIREGAGIALDIAALPPQAGPAFTPVARFLEWVGQSLATPVSFGFLGYWLLSALLIQLTARWLGGRAGAAQMLGLSGLAFAPQVLNPVSSILTYIVTVSGAGILGGINTLLGWVIWLWGLAILVKATAVAQRIDLGRSIAALLLALVFALIAVVVLAFVAGGFFAALIAVLATAVSP